ncbi:prephenate dehydrogenase [Stenotrophomonas indicatrix]|jgi:prephenate dehydrogenase|uniref:prephenate dehydrogenase n=1 Tax=Stenotrophomonas indicatrix TaxID=2045451 RepID=UPI0003EA79CB|nr:prephenate dehydrogenase [Stenotrophomonas indicatrix]EVT72147.1 prephenate dehydrogenase [Stenotrophomonas maltophilia 5BA-I-2]WGV55763.1 prephenate dehydrogenase [Stenotrophomonas indicatrix]
MSDLHERTPRTVGIVGSAGAYGRWLTRFFEQHMQVRVIGHDPADPGSHAPEQLLEQADVLVFSAPIRHTSTLIAEYARLSAGREQERLWLDVTSVKEAPVQAMLASRAEVVGLHPMTAPPKAPTLKGRVMVVCEARLQHWRPWVDALCLALQAECVRATPQHHDQMMALVQAMVHATHLAQAGVLREYQPQLGTLAAMLPYRSASFELDTAIISRILSLNPAIYEDIQFGNPYVAPMLQRLIGQLQTLQVQVGQGDDDARGAFRDHLLEANRSAFGDQALAAGNYTFERVGYLLADLTERNALSVHLPEDRAGSLRELLNVFEQHGISLASIHSSRTPAGEVHFRIGFVAGSEPGAIAAAAAEVDASGIGRVLA